MSEDHSTPGSAPAPRSWLDRLGQALSGEPRNRDELLEELRQAQANGLLSADTLAMIEGAMGVSDKQVSDVQVPRAQMVTIPVGAGLLGDLVICAPVVAREAKEQDKPVEHHYAHLTIHGVLHLLGFDHETVAEARAMEAVERQVLEKLGVPDPYSER